MQVSPQDVIDFLTVIISVGGSLFVAGGKWQGVKDRLEVIDTRLRTIEGMFTLTFKNKGESK